jgi:hypothetical protein
MSIPDVLKNSIVLYKNLTAQTDKFNDDVDVERWIFIEICEDPMLLPAKLWQLERAARCLPLLNPKIALDFASFAVLLNGEEKDFNAVMSHIRLPSNSILQNYPVIVGWVPTRNIFSSIRQINDKFDNKFQELENKFNNKFLELENKFDNKFLELENKFDKGFSELKALIEMMNSKSNMKTITKRRKRKGVK